MLPLLNAKEYIFGAISLEIFIIDKIAIFMFEA